MLGRPGRLLLIGGLALLAFLIVGRAGVGFYTEALWHRELGYLPVLWRHLGITVGVRMAAGVLAGALILLNLWLVARNLGPVRVRRRYGNIEIAERIPRRQVVAAAVALSVLGGWWLATLQFDDAGALGVAAWLTQVPFGVSDPVFGRDAGFYVFTFPVLLDLLNLLLLATVWSLALVALGHVLVGGLRWEENRLLLSRPARLHLAALLAAMLVVLGARYWLGRYALVVNGTGVGGGLGFTDAHVRIPGYWIMAAVCVAAAGAVIQGARKRSLVQPVAGLGALIAAGMIVGVAWPWAVQRFRVEPNELTREAPYIRWNIAFTRQAYGLDDLRRVRFPYHPEAQPDPAVLEPIVSRLPLWDPEPVREGFNQEQVLFRYYRFPDVDYDRYGADGEEVQVAIGVREFNPEALPEENRTWQSLHLNPEYIRGIGAVVAPTHERGSGGPDLWVRDIPPIRTTARAPEALAMRDPSIFFGETASGYVVVVPGRDSAFTGQPGVDFPAGVQLRSFLRVLAFAWRFGDESLLLSGDVGADSRLVFRRSVRERVETLAPFILWDGDPLPVVVDGRIVWMLDGFTASSSFPLARAVSLDGLRTRYLRNSVKATVDAVTGDVRFYAIDDADPILATYRSLFPNVFLDAAEMPATLRRHLRYPELALLVQAEILQEYHMNRPEAFYAGQDVWQRPQESAPNGGMREYRPTYALVPDPLGDGVEYLTLLPFLARSRQNMTAILVARNDSERYGELSLLELPRDQQVPGPGQVQTMIEQDPLIAPELSLLRQRGSGVDMGHLRVIPLDSTILYVQPLFLSAEENPIPEIWRVVVSDGREVAMAAGLDVALARLELPVETRPVLDRIIRPERETDGWAQRAIELLDRAESRLRAADWAGYGRALNELRTLLEDVGAEAGGAAGG